MRVEDNISIAGKAIISNIPGNIFLHVSMQKRVFVLDDDDKAVMHAIRLSI